MNTSANSNSFDAIEQLIFEENLRIEAVDIHPELDLMLVILNTKAVLRQYLSSYKKLKAATREHLLQYQLTNNGVGIHWPQMDEDLSLKGFLQDELRRVAKPNKDALAA